MFWIICLQINCLVAIINIFLSVVYVFVVRSKFKQLYKDVRLKKSSFSSTLLQITRLFIMSIFPLLNLVVLYTLLFRTEDIINGSVEKMAKLIDYS